MTYVTGAGLMGLGAQLRGLDGTEGTGAGLTGLERD